MAQAFVDQRSCLSYFRYPTLLLTIRIMTPIVWRVLLLAIGASGLRRDAAADASAAEVTPAGKRAVRRHRTGKKVTRGPNGTSYVFVAGVPGTGLDYWKGALRRCADAQRCQAREFAFYSGLLLGEESQVNESWVKKDKQQSDRIVPMNLVSPDPKRQPDDVFYRAFAGKLAGDAVDPRLPLYGKLAQRNGDSLKVVVLTRSSEKELLAYNMKKFNLDAEEADERLAADIGTLASQVTALPVDSYRCMRFEDTVSLGGNLKPLVKLGDLRTKALALKLRLQTTRDRYGCKFSGEALFECPHVSVSAPKVRAALDKLEQLCDPQDFITTTDSDGLSISSGKKIQWLLE
uniref:Uncharacterized protein n=1 Tax=Alexandrium monilatum TaxID=311494 RepID=A0A7S4TAP2_9DINO